MKVDIVTIFPEIARGPLEASIMSRAQASGALELNYHDLRDFSENKHRQVDDEPYGGGPGMVLKPEPFFRAVAKLRTERTRVLLMTPQGIPYHQRHAERLAQDEHLIILCGHYEGVDHRVVEALVDEEISIGDYVLTNGTVAAAVVVDSIVRLLPGVLGDDQSSVEESFAGDGKLIEGPQYTRPLEYEGRKVPDILLSGHHAKIADWRHDQAVERTKVNRPDLYEK